MVTNKVEREYHPNINKVKQQLSEVGLSYEIKEFPMSTRTAVEAANAIGCEVAHIVKSLLFMTKHTQQPVLILASGKNRVNEKRVASILGEKVIKADAQMTRKVTEFSIGGIPPLKNHKISTVLIDKDLMDFDIIWGAAGMPNAVFNLSSKDLIPLTQGQIVPIK